MQLYDLNYVPVTTCQRDLQVLIYRGTKRFFPKSLNENSA